MDLVWFDQVKIISLKVLSTTLTYFAFVLTGVDADHEMTLVKKVPYNGAYVEAAWPLGSAIEVASS